MSRPPIAFMNMFDFESIKKQAVDALDSTTDTLAGAVAIARQKGTELAKDALETTADLSRKASAAIAGSRINDDIKKTAAEALSGIGEVCDSTNEQLSNPKILMKHKVLMMGGRRAGKSTILSSILSQLRGKTPGTICTILDKTDYTEQVITPNGLKEKPTLDIKQNEVKSYILKRQRNTEFLVDMSPTYGQASYTLEVCADNTSIDLEFVDVPGEWMRANTADYKTLVQLVKTSDVFVVVIDTPYLMNTDDELGVSVNLVYNRINEITQALRNIVIETPEELQSIGVDGVDLKQIILCPVKCERWAHAEEIETVVRKVKAAYRDLINIWVGRPEVSIQIMPIETVGGIEAARMLPAKLYFRDDDDRTGVSCSVDPLTGIIKNKDGKVLRATENSFVEDDLSWTIDYMDIPLSWYRLNGLGYSPRYCEQPGFHILRFLVEKEENAIKARAETERKDLDSRNIFWRWITKIFQPTFGTYLPTWRKVIDNLKNAGLIKATGNGFCNVCEKEK